MLGAEDWHKCVLALSVVIYYCQYVVIYVLIGLASIVASSFFLISRTPKKHAMLQYGNLRIYLVLISASREEGREERTSYCCNPASWFLVDFDDSQYRVHTVGYCGRNELSGKLRQGIATVPNVPVRIGRAFAEQTPPVYLGTYPTEHTYP